MLWGGLLCGQTVIAPVVEGGASVPAPPCVTGQVYFNTGAAAGQNLYLCADNAWTQINGFARGTTAQKPAGCALGQVYFATDATAGNNLYLCTGSNTWTQMVGCASCVTGPGSSTDTYVPQWSGTSGQVLAAGLPAATLTRTIASGTAALGASSIASGACASAVTATATGALATDVLMGSFNSDPTGVTGYIPSTSGMLTIIIYPTSNTANFKVCNNTSSAVTPGAITLNWRMVR
jgi:hypothetical protein